MGTGWKTKKLLSKFWRLKAAEELGRVIRALPVRDLEESQVGAYVYSGTGKLDVDGRTVGVTLRASMTPGGIRMTVRSGDGLRAEFPLDAGEAERAVLDAVRRMAN